MEGEVTTAAVWPVSHLLLRRECKLDLTFHAAIQLTSLSHSIQAPCIPFRFGVRFDILRTSYQAQPWTSTDMLFRDSHNRLVSVPWLPCLQGRSKFSRFSESYYSQRDGLYVLTEAAL